LFLTEEIAMGRLKLWIFGSIFLLFGFPSLAIQSQKAVNKTRAYQCATYKKNAQKAKHRYHKNKKELDRLEVKLKVLSEDHLRMPAEARMASLVVSKKMEALRKQQRRNIAASKLLLAKHIEYTRAVQKACVQIGASH
jgi:hypothetical protein